MSIKKFDDFIIEDNTNDKEFLVYDLSGRSNKPYRLDKEHIKRTWDLDEVGDDDEVPLGEYLGSCDCGDEWSTNSVRFVCL